MPAVADLNGAAAQPPLSRPAHNRTKSSVLRNLMISVTNNYGGSAINSSKSVPATPTTVCHFSADSANMGYFGSDYQQDPLGELPQNRQDQFPRIVQPSPERSPDRTSSPQKSSFATISLKSIGVKDFSKSLKPRDGSPEKPKKVKSSTNLGDLLKRPKSIKNLKELITDDASLRSKEKDKENRTPPSSIARDYSAPPPIYAQFATSQKSQNTTCASPTNYAAEPPRQSFAAGERSLDSSTSDSRKPRPKSFQNYAFSQQITPQSSIGSGDGRSSNGMEERGRKKSQTWGKPVPSRPSVKNAFGFGGRTKSSTSVQSYVREPVIDPKDIDKHLEAMLDRRNIPENQRYKMRNLNNTIKMEFIRQDWAETHGQLERPRSNESNKTAEGGPDDQEDKKKKKHSRGLSLTLSRNKDKVASSSSASKKKKGDSSLGRHFRTKSTDSVMSDAGSYIGMPPSPGGSVKKGKGQGPDDFVSYLRTIQKPQLVEVGKLHKLRLLLRNETVAWIEEFIRLGGMKEIVELLYRIMAVEWREEHEDALLHENLLCLKALCTTALALQYLHSIHATLFPALLHMIFDPEKKGPSEFTTRNIITSVLLTYIECATPQERISRAQTVLRYLRDPEPKEEERPVSFVLDMRRERPYRVWCKEVVSVTKEVFWIFLHNLNIIALPSDKSGAGSISATAARELTLGTHGQSANIYTGNPKPSNIPEAQLAYLERHFPQERPPVPAAPYVGGVEWDATNYLASHLDLMNAILACTGPASEERNALRAELRISGWERCMGGSMRMCKEKFYGSVHDGLRTWVAAAVEDGWDVRDVRYGPPPESRSTSPAKKRPGNGGKGKDDAPPKIEIPRLDFNIGSGGGGEKLALSSGDSAVPRRTNDDAWL